MGRGRPGGIGPDLLGYTGQTEVCPFCRLRMMALQFCSGGYGLKFAGDTLYRVAVKNIPAKPKGVPVRAPSGQSDKP